MKDKNKKASKNKANHKKVANGNGNRPASNKKDAFAGGGNLGRKAVGATPNPYHLDMRMPSQGNPYVKGKLNMRQPQPQMNGRTNQYQHYQQQGKQHLDYIEMPRETAYDNVEERSELHEPVADFYRREFKSQDTRYRQTTKDRKPTRKVSLVRQSDIENIVSACW